MRGRAFGEAGYRAYTEVICIGQAGGEEERMRRRRRMRKERRVDPRRSVGGGQDSKAKVQRARVEKQDAEEKSKMYVA
jgi:hypothetical protein